MPKEITYKEYVKGRRKLQARLAEVKPPFFGNINIVDGHGGIEFVNSAEFCPDEAVRVAKWILEFYGENPEDVY